MSKHEVGMKAPSSAAPTLKDAIALLGDFCRLGDMRRVSKAIDILSALEASPQAAERTASADIAQAIWGNDDFQDALEMISQGIKQEQFTAYTMILQTIKSEIDASEGTKSE